MKMLVNFKETIGSKFLCMYVPDLLNDCYKSIKKKDRSTYKNVELIFKGATYDDIEEAITFLEADIMMRETVPVFVTLFTAFITVLSKMHFDVLLIMWILVNISIIWGAGTLKKERYILAIAKRIRLQKFS